MKGKNIPFKQRGRLMLRRWTKVSLTKKKRRHSGWQEGFSTITAPKQEIINNCLEPQKYWDDWEDYRDGQRDCWYDYTRIRFVRVCSCEKCVTCGWYPNRVRMNKRATKKLKIRKAKKRGRYALQ